MPISTALIIAAIVAMFVIFGFALAWADYQTRHIRPVRQRSPSNHKNDRTGGPPRRARAPSKEFAGS